MSEQYWVMRGTTGRPAVVSFAPDENRWLAGPFHSHEYAFDWMETWQSQQDVKRTKVNAFFVLVLLALLALTIMAIPPL